MDPIDRLKAYISDRMRQMTEFLKQPTEQYRRSEYETQMITVIDSCHCLVDRREGYIRTARRGTPRPVWVSQRSLEDLYQRIKDLTNLSERARNAVDKLVDEMIICLEQAIEYFIDKRQLWLDVAS
jgi:hypothetical protein